jgi:phospholipase/carboxylesterase
MNLDTVLHLLPRSGAPYPLFIYLHGADVSALAMAQVADRFARVYPQAGHLLPEHLLPDLDSARGIAGRERGETDLPGIARGIPALVAFIRDAQSQFGVAPIATALVGFSQGAVLALECAQVESALVGRVVAIAGRYAMLPQAPPASVIHLVHGKDDAIVPARHSVEAATRLVALGGDVTADVVPGVGHEPHPELVERALEHLQSFLPRRVWAEAMAEAPLIATRADSRDLDRPATPPAANDPA